ncbi:hypothetical protein ACM66B_004753 [Microbotryomycetes sp. NB124-2]
MSRRIVTVSGKLVRLSESTCVPHQRFLAALHVSRAVAVQQSSSVRDLFVQRTSSFSTTTISHAKRAKSNSKKQHKSNDEDDAADLDEQAHKLKQRGSKHSDNVKKGKNKFAITTDDNSNDVVVEGEPLLEVRFGIKESEKEMADAVDRFKVNLKNVVGRVGRVSPDLLDGLKVEMDGERRPLLEYASVSVKDGRDLSVTCYDESFVKAVSQAIYSSPHNFAPQTVSPTSLRVPVPKPNLDTRKQLVKQASDLSESARTAIRGTRTKGHKDIKADVDGKLSSKDEGQKDGKKLDAATKKHTDEVDKILEQAKKILLDE